MLIWKLLIIGWAVTRVLNDAQTWQKEKNLSNFTGGEFFFLSENTF